MAIDPRFMTWDRWIAAVAQDHFEHGPAGILTRVPETEWITWALQFISLPEHLSWGLPKPQWFQSWQDWAFATNHILFLFGE